MSLQRLVVLGTITVLLVTASAPSASAQQRNESRIAALIEKAMAHVGQVPATGTPQIDLSLDEAIALALERNLDIAVERLNPQLMDLQIAQANAAYQPTLSTSFTNSSRANPSSSQLDGGQKTVQDTQTVDTSINQSVPWGGGNFQVGWNNNRVESNNFFSSFNPSYRSTFQASYTQPLLRGFSIDSARQQLQVTAINRELSDVTLRETITNTLANVRSTYWDFVFATQSLQVQQQSLALAEQLIQDNRARVEIGTMAPIDIVQSESEAAARRQALAQAEQTLHTAQLALKRLIVGSIEDDVWQAELNPEDRPTYDSRPIDIETALRTALDQRPELVRSRRQLDIDDINVRALRNETLPALDLVGSYQLQGQGGTQTLRSRLGGNVITTIPGGFGDALGQLGSANFPVWSVQLQLSYPIGPSAAAASYARARLEVQQTQARLRQLDLQVATEVTSAALQIESIVKRIEASSAARDLAEQQLEAEQTKFQVGLSTNYFVLQAQRDLTNAQNTELQALLDYSKALVEFDRVQGTTLSRAGIITGPGGP